MLKHKCPKCGNEIGYKWNFSLYSKGYQCPKCKTKLETTIILTLTLFLSFLTGLILSDNLSPIMVNYIGYPQVTKGVITVICIISVWMVLSNILPIKLKVKRNKKV